MIVKNEKERFIDHLKNIGQYNPVMEHLIPKKNTYGSAPLLSFVCFHNKCGFLFERDCTDLLNCCHHTFSVNKTGNYTNLAFMRCWFCNVPNSKKNVGLPRIHARWNRYADTRHLKDLPLQNAVTGYWNTTIKKSHFNT